MYPQEEIDEDHIRHMFNQYWQKNDRYAPIKIVLQALYGLKTTIGTAHIV